MLAILQNVWAWPVWSWQGWDAVAGMVAAGVLLLTWKGLRAANETARTAAAATETAIREANARLERDTYRELIVEVAESIGDAQDPHSTHGQASRRRCIGLLTVLPVEAVPLPKTRMHFNVHNKPTVVPDPGTPPLEECLVELEQAVAVLFNREVLRNIVAGDSAGVTDSASLKES